MKGLRLADFAAIGIYLAILVLLTLRLFDHSGVGATVSIESNGQTWLYDLGTDAYFKPIDLPGYCEIEIKDGGVRVAYSECPLQICISMGTISRPGEWIACLPHEIMITIKGQDQSDLGVDAVAS